MGMQNLQVNGRSYKSELDRAFVPVARPTLTATSDEDHLRQHLPIPNACQILTTEDYMSSLTRPY